MSLDTKEDSSIFLLKEERLFLKKLMRHYRKIGLIIMSIGFILSIIAFIGAFYVFMIISQDVFTYYILLLVMIFIGGRLSQYGVMMIQRSKDILNPGGGRYTVYARLYCPKCGFMKTRGLQLGDFVGKRTQEKCDVCGEFMLIEKIYAKSEKPLESTGMPILPFMQGQSSLEKLKFLIVDILTPFKFSLRRKIKEPRDQKEYSHRNML